MIRQDKITFLISIFETEKFYSFSGKDEFIHDNPFLVSNGSLRSLRRIGVITRFEKKSSQILTQYIPVNRHKFLQESLVKFSKYFCFKDNPLCKKCYFNFCCDYNNKKNDWMA